MPATWAASTRQSIPRPSRSATSWAIGNTSAVGLVTALTHGEARSRGHALQDRGEHVVQSVNRKGHPRNDNACAIAVGGESQRIDGCVVLVVRRQQLVTGRETQRAEHGVDAGRGVLDEREVLRVSTKERSKLGASAIEKSFQVIVEEAAGPALETIAQLPLGAKDDPRARSKRAVIEEGDRRVQDPFVGPGRRHPRTIAFKSGRIATQSGRTGQMPARPQGAAYAVTPLWERRSDRQLPFLLGARSRRTPDRPP